MVWLLGVVSSPYHCVQKLLRAYSLLLPKKVILQCKTPIFRTIFILRWFLPLEICSSLGNAATGLAGCFRLLITQQSGVVPLINGISFRFRKMSDISCLKDACICHNTRSWCEKKNASLGDTILSADGLACDQQIRKSCRKSIGIKATTNASFWGVCKVNDNLFSYACNHLLSS